MMCAIIRVNKAFTTEYAEFKVVSQQSSRGSGCVYFRFLASIVLDNYNSVVKHYLSRRNRIDLCLSYRAYLGRFSKNTPAQPSY